LAQPPFLEDAHAICVTPFLRQELRREAVRQARRRAEAETGGGVSWSGLAGEISTRPPRGPEEIRADADAALARAAAFAHSARGRFLRSVRALERLGCVAEAETGLNAFARGFADPDRPACPAEIGVALTALARIERPEARQACLALAELLRETLDLAAA
jgi:hypothetical protein